MDINNLTRKFSVPEFKDPLAPKREIDLSAEDVCTVTESIAKLDQSGLNKDELFEIF